MPALAVDIGEMGSDRRRERMDSRQRPHGDDELRDLPSVIEAQQVDHEDLFAIDARVKRQDVAAFRLELVADAYVLKHIDQYGKEARHALAADERVGQDRTVEADVVRERRDDCIQISRLDCVAKRRRRQRRSVIAVGGVATAGRQQQRGGGNGARRPCAEPIAFAPIRQVLPCLLHAAAIGAPVGACARKR